MAIKTVLKVAVFHSSTQERSFMFGLVNYFKGEMLYQMHEIETQNEFSADGLHVIEAPGGSTIFESVGIIIT
jgi:hypothetical protein